MACQSLIGTPVNGDDAVAGRRARRAPPRRLGSTWPMTAGMGSQKSKPRPLNSSAGSVRWRRCAASGTLMVAERVLTVAAAHPERHLTAGTHGLQQSKDDIALAL